MSQDITIEFSFEIETLDTIKENLINTKNISKEMIYLKEWLLNRRVNWDNSTWNRFCQDLCLNHPLKDLLHQDPIYAPGLHKAARLCRGCCFNGFSLS